jgi:hypothetical protein
MGWGFIEFVEVKGGRLARTLRLLGVVERACEQKRRQAAGATGKAAIRNWEPSRARELSAGQRFAAGRMAGHVKTLLFVVVRRVMRLARERQRRAFRTARACISLE